MKPVPPEIVEAPDLEVDGCVGLLELDLVVDDGQPGPLRDHFKVVLGKLQRQERKGKPHNMHKLVVRPPSASFLNKGGYRGGGGQGGTPPP